MKTLLKAFKLVFILLMVSGCANFKKPGDTLVKSPCEVCKQKPFYVNGRRI